MKDRMTILTWLKALAVGLLITTGIIMADVLGRIMF